MYYLVELLNSPCIILTQVLVKMLRYNCMYKYKIVYDDWFDDLSNIFNRIDNQIKNTTQLDDLCLAGNCSGHVTVASYNLLIAIKYVT